MTLYLVQNFARIEQTIMELLPKTYFATALRIQNIVYLVYH